jgi:hypothetical protein
MNTWKTSRGTAVTEVRRSGLGAADPTTVQTAAQAMNDALNAHGYCQADTGLYSVFQSAVGFTADGFPGQNTMIALRQTLTSAGIAMANVTIYPWTGDANGGGQAAYDGTNAPTWAEWTTCSGGPSPTPTIPTIVVPGTVPAPTSTATSSSSSNLPWILGGLVLVAGSFAAYTYSKKKKH